MPFNPNEPRDKKGLWTTGGGDKPSIFLSDSSEPGRVRAEIISSLAAQSAAALDYDPGTITVTDAEHPFMLNGVEHKASGIASLDDGKIVLFANQIKTNEDVPSVMAHEVMHQKYQTFVNDAHAERTKMESDPDYRKETKTKWVKFDPNNPVHAESKRLGNMVTTDGQIREHDLGFMRADGLLNEPYASRYPTYQAYTKATMADAGDFAKTDGVSGYSREWWDAWKAKTANTSQAMHETLAEMARLKFEGNKITHIMRKPDGFLTTRKTTDPRWNTLYKAVEDHWKKRAKK